MSGGLSRALAVTNPDSHAAWQAAEWHRKGRAADAALMDRIAGRPQAEWITGPNPRPIVEAHTKAAARAGQTAVLVAYHIPNRDCGHYSAGGAQDGASYRAWIEQFAAGLGDRRAYVVVEPDAVAQVAAGCARAAAERFGLLAYAVDRLKRQPHARVYLDAGNSGWIPETGRLIGPLKASGAARADGFALNVSNFQTNEDSQRYGDSLSSGLGGAHYVVDTSRNGNGPYTDTDAEAWCNPPGRALGTAPTGRTGHRLLDAYLWIKRPGESDGTAEEGQPRGSGGRPTRWTSHATPRRDSRRPNAGRRGTEATEVTEIWNE